MTGRSFYHYGEGAVTHGDEPCPEGIGLHHPQIQRTAWPSRWHYYRHFLALWWDKRWMRRLARTGYFKRQRDRGITREYMADLPTSWLDRLGFRLFGPSFPQHPTVWAPLRPEESIYPDAVDEAERWVARRAAAPPSQSTLVATGDEVGE